jgi:hypothetical protein
MSKVNDHYYEASYQIWRSGYNPDRIDWNRSDDDYEQGRSPEYTANREIEIQHRERQRRIDLEQSEESW